MVPLQTILLLILVGSQELYFSSARAPATVDAAFNLLSLFLTHLFLVLIVSYRANIAVRRLHVSSTDSSMLTYRMDRLFSHARWATVAITALHLLVFNLHGAVTVLLARTHFLHYVPLISQAIILTPALLSWMGFWTSAYRLESAARERAFPYRLAHGLPVHDMPALPRYLTMQARHSFFPIVPVMLYLLINEAGEYLQPRLSWAPAAAAILSIIVMLVLTPWIITRIWSTVPLTGPLRMRLDAVAAAYRLRFRNILLWRTHNVIINAAIMGYLPFARYFFMTDGLLETLTDRQLEAVFAHEVGHGVHWHIPWYITAFIGAVFLGVGVQNFSVAYLHVPDSNELLSIAQLLPMAILVLFMIIGFPFFSHRFEHQADWFAARHMARALGLQPPLPGLTATILVESLASEPRTIEILPIAPTPAEDITLEQYAAGQYPHAASSPPSPPVSALLPAGNPGEAASPAPVAGPTTNCSNSSNSSNLANAATSTAGAEIFISALDTLVEATHRTRNRAGWMHPSINGRINLLRTLSADPAAAQRFEHKMRTTRLLIVGLFILGICTVAIALLHPDPPSKSTTVPASQSATQSGD